MLQKLAPAADFYNILMLRKPAHLIFYVSTLQKPPEEAGFCNVLKYKADTFYLSTIQKPAPGIPWPDDVV